MRKILITGGTGVLGSSLVSYFKNLNYELVVQGFQNNADIKADMTQLEIVTNLLDDINPDIIINLICLSNVEENEKNHDLANQLNVKPVENITSWIKSKNKNLKFIQISTDHLYDREGFNGEDEVIIRNEYASTKYAAEKVALEVDGLVLRTNFFGKSLLNNRNSFTDWIDRSIEDKDFPIKLFSDVYFSPLSLDTLSRMISHAAENFESGIYNLGSKNGMSKAEFVYSYSNFLRDNKILTNPISVNDMDFLAVRPKGMMMDVSKFEKSFRVNLPTLQFEIDFYKNRV